ncbi:MAG: WecB/TagA/CpsF family glycosyltransferase [Pontibacterium sp.]
MSPVTSVATPPDLLAPDERRVIDDFHRDIWCLLGLPIDASTTPQTLDQLYLRIIDPLEQSPLGCFLTTPNLNFVIAALRDPTFRESVINSDWVVADGMPLVWVAQALNVPITERIAGSSLIDKLRFESGPDRRPLRIFFFGGPDGVAKTACEQLEREHLGLEGAGYCSPGFGSIESMSTDEIIDSINASEADIVLVALGAKRGQAWIEYNRSRLKAPAISHLGAVVNFVAGTVTRAPLWMQRSGTEWLWRIYEERNLLKRYWSDGLRFLHLYVTRVRPYQKFIQARAAAHKPTKAEVRLTEEGDHLLKIHLTGSLIHAQLADIRVAFCRAALAKRDIELDLGACSDIDPAFIGQLLLLRKYQNSHNKRLRINGVDKWRKDVFRYNCVEYLLQRS